MDRDRVSALPLKIKVWLEQLQILKERAAYVGIDPATHNDLQ